MNYSHLILACILSFLLPPTAIMAQLEIKATYKDKGMNPVQDSDGEHLQRVVNHAVDYWESIYSVSDIDKKLKFWYAYVDSSKARKKLFSKRIKGPERVAAMKEPTPMRKRRIFFRHANTESGEEMPLWSYGTSMGYPDGEFLIKAVEGRDLDGDIVDAQENQVIGYFGNQHSERYDMLTVSLHEIGHILLRPKKLQKQFDSGTDLLTVEGDISTYEVKVIDENGIIDALHLKYNTLLMTDSLNMEVHRYLPSLIDIECIAQVNKWSSYNNNFMISDQGETPRHWLPERWWPNRSTTSEDNVVIRGKGPVRLVTPESRCKSLQLNSQTNLDIGQFTLLVEHDVMLTGENFIQLNGGILQAKNMVIAYPNQNLAVDGGGELRMKNKTLIKPKCNVFINGGIGPSIQLFSKNHIELGSESDVMVLNVEISSDSLHMDSLSILHGGTSNFHISNYLYNSGTIRAENGDLRFNVEPVSRLDLDGSEEDRPTHCLNALGGSIYFSQSVIEEFNESMNIGNSNTISFEGDFAFGPNSKIELGTSSILAANELNCYGGKVNLQALASSKENVESLIIGSQSWLGDDLIQIGEFRTLILNGHSTFYTGQIAAGEGVLCQNGNVDVKVNPGRESSVSSLEVAYYNWNGCLPEQENFFHIDSGAVLIIYSQVPAFIGHLEIESEAQLFVDSEVLENNGEMICDGQITCRTFYNNGNITGTGKIICDVLEGIGLVDPRIDIEYR